MIGIYIRYTPNENTYLALQLASWLRAQGQAVSVLSLGKRNKSVYSQWDNEVRTDSTVDFKEWANQCSHIVWFYDISPSDFLYAKSHRIKTVLVASWDDPNSHISLYQLADKVVCLSPSLAHRIRGEYQLRNLVYAPTDLPEVQPRSSITIRPDRPKVLLNLRGPRNNQLGSSLLQTLTNWFHQIQIEWTIWVPKSLLNEKAWIHKALVSPHPDSLFHFTSNADWDSQRLLYGWHDLVIWPTLRTGHAMSIVLPLLMGCPVITYDVPPANEYLSKDNGVLSPCIVKYDDKGMGTLIPDLHKLEIIVSRVLQQKNTLAKLKRHTSDWTEERRKLFNEGWKEVFKL